MKLLEVTSLQKAFGPTPILSGVSFSLNEGETLCLLGPNGAGKTTTIKCVLGLLIPDSGKITLGGADPSSKVAQRQLGCMPQDSDFPEQIKVREVLEFVAAHYDDPEDVDEIMRRFFLTDLSKRRVHQLSGGQRRCLGLAAAFVGRPKVLVLDEPTVALDVEIRQVLWKEILAFQKKGGGILLTTHYLEEAEALADRILVINKGSIVREGSTQDIKNELGYFRVSFQCDQNVELTSSIEIHQQESTFRVLTDNADATVKELVEKYPFKRIEVTAISLEEAFIKIIEKDR